MTFKEIKNKIYLHFAVKVDCPKHGTTNYSPFFRKCIKCLHEDWNRAEAVELKSKSEQRINEMKEAIVRANREMKDRGMKSDGV